MKKRIMSLVLALTMCLSMFTFGIVAESATLGELMEIYKERVWDWQDYQFNAMTDEQKSVIDDAWTNYEANSDAIREEAVKLVDDILDESRNAGLTKFYGAETMKDLYKWKLMRDIMEGRIDATSDDADYQDWLARFTVFEEDNDEKISASAPMAALNGLDAYSDDLTVYFGELAEMAVNGFAFEGADADKANAYLAAYQLVGNEYVDDMDSIHEYLVADVKELVVDGIVNNFEIGMQLATGQITRENTTGVFDMISDRNMKAAFLLVGEDVVDYALDLIPGLRGDILALNKKDIVEAVIGDATPILGGNNVDAVDALYNTMNNVIAYMLDEENGANMEKIENAEDYISGALGIEIKDEYEKCTEALKTVMGIIDSDHGLELVHLNTYLGRELLRYENEGEYVYLKGAEIDGDTVGELTLGFGHNRYPIVSSFNDFGIASFDANYDADGIKVYAHEENVGQLVIEVTEEANATATVNVYRGYTDDDLDGVVDNEEDVLRYVTTFTVKATSDVEPPVVEDPYVTLEDVLDTTVDGTIEVKGTTNLDYVTVAIVKTVEGEAKTIYAVVYEKAEFEAGITLNAPDAAVEGEVYTVVVGTEKASDSDEFTIISDEEPIVYEITLDDIADFRLSDNENAEIVVKGTTNLENVVVSITLNGDEVYTVVHTKAEFEAGITIAIDNAVAGNVYTVAVGQTGTEAEDTFEILPEEVVPVDPSLALAGKDTRNVGKNKTITITTTPQNVPAGSTAEVVWTTEDGEIIEVTATSGDSNNIATVKGLKKGTTTLTATLYVDGVATNASVTLTVKVVTSTPGPSTTSYTNITVKVDETKDVVKVPAGGVNVEFNGTGDGEVEVTIVDGVVVVTGVKIGEVKGTVKVTNEKGRTVLTGDYKFTVTEKDVVVVPEHECEWPDIAATATKDAHWAHETIDIMTINGYIKGYDDGTFKPDQNITRAEFSAIVYRILGLEVAEDGVLYDDTVGHWAEDIIATMSLPEGYGMLRGYGDGNFGPNDNITREQAVAIIARAKSAVWVAAEDGAKDVFTDAEDISWWFDGEMDAAVTNGLITGYQDGSYKPLEFTTRAEACVLLARAWPEILE